jgi:ribosome-binding factor A
MKNNRIKRLNSLLKEVLSEVINRDIYNPDIAKFTTVTNVEITKDLHHAKVYISILSDDESQKGKTIAVLQHLARQIAFFASKKMVIRYFPALTFILDNTADEHFKIDHILKTIEQEKQSRHHNT